MVFFIFCFIFVFHNFLGGFIILNVIIDEGAATEWFEADYALREKGITLNAIVEKIFELLGFFIVEFEEDSVFGDLNEKTVPNIVL